MVILYVEFANTIIYCIFSRRRRRHSSSRGPHLRRRHGIVRAPTLHTTTCLWVSASFLRSTPSSAHLQNRIQHPSLTKSARGADFSPVLFLQRRENVFFYERGELILLFSLSEKSSMCVQRTRGDVFSINQVDSST